MTDSSGCCPIFIVGCPRSGTHLLRNMLRGHPNLSFAGETHFIPKLYRKYGNPENGKEAEKLASMILDLQWIKAWNLSLDPESFADDRSYAGIVGRIFEAWAQGENKHRWGDKTPQYVTEMPALLELFPGCRFIHIIRDGRDVALSWVPAFFGPNNIYTAAGRWKSLVEAGRRTGRSLSEGTYLEIQYETLLSGPEPVMKDICTFLEEPFCDELLKPDPLILEYPERGPIFGSNKRPGSHSLKTTIVNDNSTKWKNRMSGDDILVFESVAGDLLESLGYEISSGKREISKPERIFWELHNSIHWFINSLNCRNRIAWLKTDWLLR